MNRGFQIKEDHLLRYFHKASALTKNFDKIEKLGIYPARTIIGRTCY